MDPVARATRKFWAHLVRSTMRQVGLVGRGAARATSCTSDVDPPRAHVTVDAISQRRQIRLRPDTTLQVIDPEHPAKAAEVPLSQTAPAATKATFTLDRYGTFLLRAVHNGPARARRRVDGTVSLPYPREYLALPPDEPLLQRVAALTGGRARPAAAQLFDPVGEKVPFHRELWRWALWLAAFLLLLDVAARRVRFL